MNLLPVLKNRNVLTVIVCLVLCLITFAFGRFSAPTKVKTVTVTKVVTQTVVQWKDKIVTKVVYVKEKQTVVSKDTTTTTTKKPDGTTVTQTETKENLQTNTQVSSNQTTTNNQSEAIDKTTTSNTSTTTTKERSTNDWMVSLSLGYSKKLFNEPFSVFRPDVGAQIQRRIIGPVYLGVYVQAPTDSFDPHVGILGSLSF